MSPFIKYLIVFALIVIIYNLFKAFYHLFNKQSQPKDVVKSLAIRIGFPLVLFIALIVASFVGIIKPHGLTPTQQIAQPELSQQINKKGATQ